MPAPRHSSLLVVGGERNLLNALRALPANEFKIIPADSVEHAQAVLAGRGREDGSLLLSYS